MRIGIFRSKGALTFFHVLFFFDKLYDEKPRGPVCTQAEPVLVRLSSNSHHANVPQARKTTAHRTSDKKVQFTYCKPLPSAKEKERPQNTKQKYPLNSCCLRHPTPSLSATLRSKPMLGSASVYSTIPAEPHPDPRSSARWSGRSTRCISPLSSTASWRCSFHLDDGRRPNHSSPRTCSTSLPVRPSPIVAFGEIAVLNSCLTTLITSVFFFTASWLPTSMDLFNSFDLDALLLQTLVDRVHGAVSTRLLVRQQHESTQEIFARILWQRSAPETPSPRLGPALSSITKNLFGPPPVVVAVTSRAPPVTQTHRFRSFFL